MSYSHSVEDLEVTLSMVAYIEEETSACCIPGSYLDSTGQNISTTLYVFPDELDGGSSLVFEQIVKKSIERRSLNGTTLLVSGIATVTAYRKGGNEPKSKSMIMYDVTIKCTKVSFKNDGATDLQKYRVPVISKYTDGGELQASKRILEGVIGESFSSSSSSPKRRKESCPEQEDETLAAQENEQWALVDEGGISPSNSASAMRQSRMSHLSASSTLGLGLGPRSAYTQSSGAASSASLRQSYRGQEREVSEVNDDGQSGSRASSPPLDDTTDLIGPTTRKDSSSRGGRS
ncbi:hypothetical protein BGX21_001497 [Mortierella sp. AD011]|nr:hypothetical protein BGX20_004447 [Mortierella sp. AD010]KAF9383809.1 hypothetical protein BGX21_001497 [Mortierella sp. AD011]